MNKRSIGLFLAAAGVATLALAFAVNAQEVPGTVNDNANGNINVPLPPPPPPKPPVSSDNTNDNTVLPPTAARLAPGEGDNRPIPTLFAEPSSSSDTNSPSATTASPNIAPQPMLVGEGDNGQKSSTGGKRVKIPHPQYIKYFTDIKQMGGSLYGIMSTSAKAIIDGIKTDAGVAPSTDNSTVSPTAANDTNTGAADQTMLQRVEKIISPAMIKYYTSIKKIGTSLFGVRKDGGEQKPSAPKTHPVITADESACVIAAIGVKDQSVVDAKTAEAASFNTAVSARTACQGVALGATDGQAAALQACNKNFVTAANASRDAFAKARQAVWTTYTTALKACAPATSTVSGTTPVASPDIMVEDGSNVLDQPPVAANGQ